MLEFALQKYPSTFRLKDGKECVVRPLKESDEVGFHEFHLEIPEDERMFIKHRVTDQALFHEWCSEIDYERNLPLLVLANNKIIADGTLHQRAGGWKRHIGLVSILTLPDYRGRGIASHLLSELVEIARHSGLVRLEAEFNGDRGSLSRALASRGFRELVRLPKYVQDMHCKHHDYVLMGRDLLTDEEYASAGD